jgi:hypothetical protein
MRAGDQSQFLDVRRCTGVQPEGFGSVLVDLDDGGDAEAWERSPPAASAPFNSPIRSAPPGTRLYVPAAGWRS